MTSTAENHQSQLNLADSTLLKTDAYINGEWCGATDNARFDVTNPATGAVITTLPDMGVAETREAIEAAERAWAAWRQKTGKERAGILRKMFFLMMDNQEDLAQLITAEGGKPIAESRGEVAYGASFIEWFGEEAKRTYGDLIPATFTDRRIVADKQPIGVCAAITPWNFPIAMVTRKVGPALAAGCPIVLKPAHATPLSALALAELAERAGVPAGVFSVVTSASGRKVGGELTSNPIVRKLTFTLDRDRQSADAPVCGHDQKDVAGTRRQRPVYRVRRRRHRQRRRRRDGIEVPQYGPDLRVRQSLPGSGRRLRRICEQARYSCRGDEGWQWCRGRCRTRAIDKRGRSRESTRACR
jgi:hypothetical protein